MNQKSLQILGCRGMSCNRRASEPWSQGNERRQTFASGCSPKALDSADRGPPGAIMAWAEVSEGLRHGNDME